MIHSSHAKLASCFVVLSAALLPAVVPRKVAAQAAPAISQREQLQQYLKQLQANPSDDGLRTKIIHGVDPSAETTE